MVCEQGTVSMHRLVQDVQRRQLARASAGWEAAVRLVPALLKEAIPSVGDDAALEEARSVGPLLTHLHALMAASPTGEMPTGLMSADLFDKAADAHERRGEYAKQLKLRRLCERRAAKGEASAYAQIDEQPGLALSPRVSMQRRLRCIARCCR